MKKGHGADWVVSKIREMIQRGELRLGDRLPPERELAKELGISRPTLRAGLRSLIAMGILQAKLGSGTFVSEGPPVLDSKPLSMLAEIHGFTTDEMFEARRVLEVGLAGMAAERASPDHLASLAEELADMYASIDDPVQYLVHDMRFHRAIAGASGNPILATLMQMVSAAIFEQRKEIVQRSRDREEATALHRKIYRAIRARDIEEARAAMNEHLMTSQEAISRESEAVSN